MSAMDEVAGALTLPPEILRVVTSFIDDVPTLFSWSQVCKTTRTFCKEKTGEKVYRACLKHRYPYCHDLVLLATRVEYLSLYDDWNTQPDTEWTFRGETLCKEWFQGMLEWPCSKVYEICLKQADKRGWLPWSIEYVAVREVEKLALAFLMDPRGVESVSMGYLDKKMLAWRKIDDTIEEQMPTMFHVNWFPCFALLRIWDTFYEPDYHGHALGYMGDQTWLRFESWGFLDFIAEIGSIQKSGLEKRLEGLYSLGVVSETIRLRCGALLAATTTEKRRETFACEYAMKYANARKLQRRMLREAKRHQHKFILYTDYPILVERKVAMNASACQSWMQTSSSREISQETLSVKDLNPHNRRLSRAASRSFVLGYCRTTLQQFGGLSNIEKLKLRSLIDFMHGLQS